MKWTLIPIAILLLMLSCSHEQKKAPPSVSTDTADSLTRFFNMCRSDLEKAKTVILENDLIKNLSHLQYMNYGGQKYYLLERESLTRMIQSVTEGVYTDYIIIAKNGTVIYTMMNDDVFSKNVLSNFRSTALSSCYENRNDDIHIEDVSTIDPKNAIHSIFISTKIKGGDTFPGIFILQVDISKIRERIPRDAFIVGVDKKYKIFENTDMIATPFPNADLIDFTAVGKKLKAEKFTYTIYKYADLTWAILEP